MLLGFWLAAVILFLGLVIWATELAPPLWPRRACRRSESHWRAEEPTGFGCTYGAPQYFKAAPAWYRLLTWLFNSWRWVRL